MSNPYYQGPAPDDWPATVAGPHPGPYVQTEEEYRWAHGEPPVEQGRERFDDDLDRYPQPAGWDGSEWDQHVATSLYAGRDPVATAPQLCHACGGSGEAPPGASWADCQRCHGTGWAD